MSANNTQLIFPTAGSTNWAPAMNRNMRILDNKIQQAYQQINAISNLAGGRIPYIASQVGHKYVSLIITNEQLTELRYSDTIIMESDGNIILSDYISYYASAGSDQKSFNDIKLNLAAYVVSVSGGSFIDIDSNTPIEQGDLFVKITEFNTLYSNNIQQTTFKKYPVVNQLFIPSVDNITDESYNVKFTKSNIVEFDAKAKDLEFSLPQMGMKYFATGILQWNDDGNTTIEFTLPNNQTFNDAPLMPQVHLYNKINDRLYPILMDYSINGTEVSINSHGMLQDNDEIHYYIVFVEQYQNPISNQGEEAQ